VTGCCFCRSRPLKRTIPSSGLQILPRTGHTANLEEPDLFNRIAGEYLSQVDSGRWRPRDPRSYNKSNLLKK